MTKSQVIEILKGLEMEPVSTPNIGLYNYYLVAQTTNMIAKEQNAKIQAVINKLEGKNE